MAQTPEEKAADKAAKEAAKAAAKAEKEAAKAADKAAKEAEKEAARLAKAAADAGEAASAENGIPKANGRYQVARVEGGYRVMGPQGQWISDVLDQATANDQATRHNSFNR